MKRCEFSKQIVFPSVSIEKLSSIRIELAASRNNFSVSIDTWHYLPAILILGLVKISTVVTHQTWQREVSNPVSGGYTIYGLINFYHWFIPHCVDIVRPLHTSLATTKTKQPLAWDDNTVKAFNDINQAIASASLLSYPTPDAPINIMTDVSNTAVGAVLQLIDNT